MQQFSIQFSIFYTQFIDYSTKSNSNLKRREACEKDEGKNADTISPNKINWKNNI